MKIEEGKSLGIAGESGCGKSTLALSMMGYYFAPLHYISGDIIVDGKNISNMKAEEVRKNILGSEIAYIPQAAMNALNPTQKVISLIQDVILAHDPKVTKKDIHNLARERFELLGLPPEVLEKHAVELSGGMKKRVSLARAIAFEPKILLYDEPSSGLDPVTSAKIDELIVQMQKLLGVTSIVVTHDMKSAFYIADRIAMLYQGEMIAIGTPDEIRNSTDSRVLEFINVSQIRKR